MPSGVISVVTRHWFIHARVRIKSRKAHTQPEACNSFLT